MTRTSRDAPGQDGDSRPLRIGERSDDRRIDGATLLGSPAPASLADPYPGYARLRAEDPVHRTSPA